MGLSYKNPYDYVTKDYGKLSIEKSQIKWLVFFQVMIYKTNVSTSEW